MEEDDETAADSEAATNNRTRGAETKAITMARKNEEVRA
jgi:hypothetical protein